MFYARGGGVTTKHYIYHVCDPKLWSLLDSDERSPPPWDVESIEKCCFLINLKDKELICRCGVPIPNEVKCAAILIGNLTEEV
jgi:hypothetical protein